ncbi:MAG: DNA translocase FtsK 4TM domain-containing protein, partial [Alcanivorax nanhaiticus]
MSKTVAGQGESGFSRHLKRGLVEGTVIALIALSAYLLLALVTFDSRDPGWSYVGHTNAVHNAAGRAGAFSADMLFSLFGFMAYLFPVLVAFWAGKVLKERHAGLPGSWPLFSLRLVGFVLTMLAGTALSYMHFSVGDHLPEGAGGILGHQMGQAALDGFNPLGGTLVMVALFLIGVTVFTDLSWIALAEGLGALVMDAFEKLPAWWQARKQKREAQKQKKDAHEKRAKVIEEARKKAETRKPVKIAQPAKPVEKSVRVQKEKQQKLFTTEVTGELPPIGL